jgi:hypothetical protein
LFFSRSSSLHLQAYCDANWVSDTSHRRSLFAHCVFLGGSLITWKTKKQVAVSHSSAEAKLRAMTLVTAEITWLRWLLEDFGISVSMSLLSILVLMLILYDTGSGWCCYSSICAFRAPVDTFLHEGSDSTHYQFYLSKLSFLDPQ